MPTGYTQPLYDNEPITFEQFVLRCAHGMGAAIMQRDEPLNTPLQLRTVPDYTVQHVGDAVTALAAAFQRTDEEWAAQQAEEVEAARRHHDEYMESRRGVFERYQAMRDRVQEWEPPTEEHEGLKGFMLNQLRDSIQFDSGGSYEPPVPEVVDVAEYREREIGRLSRQLEQRTTELQEERQRVREQNAWVEALHASLGQGDAQ